MEAQLLGVSMLIHGCHLNVFVMNPKDRLKDLVPFHWGLSSPLLLGNVMCDQHTAIQLSVQHLHILTAAYSL